MSKWPNYVRDLRYEYVFMKRKFKQWWQNKSNKISTKWSQPRTIDHKTTHNSRFWLGTDTTMWRVKPLKGIPSPSHNWISIDNININKQWKVCTNSLSLQKTRHYHKIELQHKHGQYDSRINACSSLLAIGQLAKKVESAS